MEDKELEYIHYFGLHYNPFPVAPDSENFYLSAHIDQILTELVHGVVVKKGFMVLTGEIGLGKTTISRKIMNILEEKEVETSLVLLSLYQDVELIKEINRDFGIDTGDLELSVQIGLLNDFLIEKHQEDKNCAIIIDDAQNLTHESLELIRMISNLETDHEKLVQILLIGQPELNEKLNAPQLRQLKSRIVINENAQPLTKDELKNYILFKLSLAGNTGKTIIANSAFEKISRYSEGNFRAVNILMDRCLYVAFLSNNNNIDTSVVNEAYKDLGWNKNNKNNKNNENSKTNWLLPLLIVLLISITVLLWYNLKLFAIFGTSNTINNSVPVMEDIKKSEFSEEKEKTPAPPIKEKVEEEVADKIPEAITNFLSGYDLAEFAPPLFEAMANGHYDNISDTIFNKSGYRLILLNRVPDHIRSQYGILSLSFKDNQEEQYILFWKPTVQIDKFYLDYQGKEIGFLERKLTNLGLYSPPFDNVVGGRLMRGLNSYQESRGIEQTGFPDTKTLFMLSNE